jgi:hypothetical protein
MTTWPHRPHRKDSLSARPIITLNLPPSMQYGHRGTLSMNPAASEERYLPTQIRSGPGRSRGLIETTMHGAAYSHPAYLLHGFHCQVETGVSVAIGRRVSVPTAARDSDWNLALASCSDRLTLALPHNGLSCILGTKPIISCRMAKQRLELRLTPRNMQRPDDVSVGDRVSQLGINLMPRSGFVRRYRTRGKHCLDGGFDHIGNLTGSFLRFQ